MTQLIFLACFVAWASVSSYHLWRFALRRRIVSIAVAVYPMGWVLFAAREMRWISRDYTTPFVALSLVTGLTSVMMILMTEAQRQRPFR